MNERPAERLHGDLERQPVRLLTPATPLPQHVSWYRLDPGGTCTLHVHTGKTETWLVVDGTGEARIGEAAVAIRPGDVLVTEPGTPHGMVNTGATALRFVNIVAVNGPDSISTRELEDL
ncbi:MAG: hypothetical protein AcusKO_32600 [Acuticoccus sp.]